MNTNLLAVVTPPSIYHKPLFNYTHYSNKIEEDLNGSTDNSPTEIDDYLNKLNVKRIKIRMMNTKIMIHKILTHNKL